MTSSDSSLEAQVLREKDLGNAALKANQLDNALQHYSRALELDPTHAVSFSNRSAVYLRLQQWDRALADAELCIENRRAWEKGYARKGCALFGLRRFAEAKDAFRKAEEFQPGQYKEEIAQCDAALGGSSSSSSRPSRPSTVGSVGVLQALDQLQLLVNFLVPVCGVLYVMSLVGAAPVDLNWYAWCHRMNIASGLFALFRLYGLPKLSKEYFQRLLPDFWASVIMSSFILSVASPFLAGLMGACVRAIFHLGLSAPQIYPGLAANEYIRKIRDNQVTFSSLLNSIEATLGFIMVLNLLSPPRDFMAVILYWNFLRFRYMTNESTRVTFSAIRQKLDSKLLGVPMVSTLYVKVRDFMAKASDPQRAR